MRRTFVAPIVAAVALSACGGSSKPGYCSDRSELEQSVKDLGNVKALESGGAEKLRSQLRTIESNAGTLVNSAKSDFPTETSAIDSSLSRLKADAQKLPSSPSPKQLAVVGTDAKAVVTSVQGFIKASDSKC